MYVYIYIYILCGHPSAARSWGSRPAPSAELLEVFVNVQDVLSVCFLIVYVFLPGETETGDTRQYHHKCLRRIPS